MFDKLEDIVLRLEEVLNQLQEPDVANDQNRFRKLMKEQAELTPIVEAYKEYKACKQNIEDSLELLNEESDEEMRELAKEELNESKARVEELENELKILMMIRTLSWRSVLVRVEMRQHCLRQRSTVCMYTMQRAVDGR